MGAPFEWLTDAAASALLEAEFGIPDATLTRLDTERDDSFHVVTPEAEFSLKVAHPLDSPALIDLQSAAVSHVAGLLPVQRVLKTVQGERVARLLTWLPGTPVFDVLPDDRQVGLLGETLGRLNASLVTFEHPEARRVFPWDALRLPDLRTLGESPAFEWFEADVIPNLAELPRQVIHNDFHLGNVLADPATEGYVTGVLDFGDVVHSARIADVAVAASYLISPARLGWRGVELFLAGFERHVAVTDLERTVLPALVAARFAQRILINDWLRRDDPVHDSTANRAALADLLERRS